MKKEQVIEMAKHIIELDIKRDALFEEFMEVTGDKGHEILRYVQNFMATTEG